jgi:hypothetical protein
MRNENSRKRELTSYATLSPRLYPRILITDFAPFTPTAEDSSLVLWTTPWSPAPRLVT